MLLIEVTYGTREHMVYARTEKPDDAEALKAAAIRLGYRDARIVKESAFRAAQQAARQKQLSTQ